MVLLALTGTPITLALAWWFWLRRSARAPSPSWRKRLLLSGLAAASCNVLLYTGYLVYWRKYMYVPDFWKVGDACGNLGGGLALWGLMEKLAGKGPARILFVNCILGIMLWIPLAIL